MAGRRPAITGVVLAGGRARRMGGQDKGLIALAGRPLAQHALEALAAQVPEVLVNANRNLDHYRALGAAVVSDSIGGFCGPLAGMLAALEVATQPALLTVPCDSPLLAPDYASRMLAALESSSAELAVAHDGERLQPVFALLPRALLPSLQAYLAGGGRKIDVWFAGHAMTRVDFSDRPGMFRNINTPEELAALETELAAGSPPARH